ncbi:MAG: hypothetical protein ACI85F_002463 [Bacteroidia bacterium]|jgi:hypothetical protein
MKCGFEKADVPQHSEAYLLGVARSRLWSMPKVGGAKKGLARTMVIDYHCWWLIGYSARSTSTPIFSYVVRLRSKSKRVVLCAWTTLGHYFNSRERNCL